MKEHLDEKAMKQYTEMLIEQIQQMKESNWEKPWFSSNNFVTPQNINGRLYSGGNLLMLMFNQQKHGYQLPVYMTFQQAGHAGLAVNKGEKSFPICYWNRSIKDENGKKLTENEYDELSEDDKLKCKIRAYQQYFNVFNVEQTNIKAVKPDLWDALVNKLQPPVRELDDTDMLKCPELDKMLQDQSWLCSIHLQPNSNDAYYHKGDDAITVPEKKQFIDGESFYGTLLHEMVHSTGIEDRLNRDMSGGFGSVSYSREELVAELGSAMAAINFGINKGIKDESKEYIKGWLDNMNQDPKFLMSVIGDIAKAVDFIHKNVPEIAAENKQDQEQENSLTDGSQETVYYTSVAYLQNSDDTVLFDRLKESGDYERLMTEATEYDFSYEDGIDLAHTHLSATTNTGDDILVENEHYAVVYNNSVGGTYDILRKTPESEIWQMIQSDYLPKDASPDVRRLAERKTLEEIDNNPDISHTFSMPNGRELEWQFNRDKFTIEVGERTGDNLDVRHSIPYDFGVSLDEVIKDIHTDLSSNLEYMIPTEEKEEEEEEKKEEELDKQNVFSNIRTVDESLRDDLIDGTKTLHEAGVSLHKAGLKNYIPDAQETLKLLHINFDGMKHSKGEADETPIKIDESALMTAVNFGVDVSLRDFAIGLPPTDRRMAMSLAGLVLETTEKNELLSGLIEENLQVDSYKIEKIWSIKESYERDEIDLDYMVRFYTNNLDELLLNKTTHRIGVDKNELEEEKAEVKETVQVSDEGKEESKLDLFQRVVDATLQGKHVNMPYEVYELLESMTDSELQQAKAIAEKRKGRSNTVKVNMSDIRIKVEQQMKTRADDRNPEQAEKRVYEQTMKSMRESGTLFMARFDFESYIRHQKTDEEEMLQKNHPGAAAAHQGAIRAAQEYEKILDREIEMLNKATLQHDNLKDKHPDAILFIRTGDSYMVIREDAQTVSQITDLQPKPYPLTKGEQPKEFLAVEFPVSKLDTYLPQMVRAGVRVAICDWMDTPKVSTRQEPGKKETPKLHFYYTGNGISITEEGDKSYTGHISQEREVSLHKEFHPDNVRKIKDMAEKGNMTMQNGPSNSYLVLDPLNKPSKIHENPVTLERYFLSVENVDGKEMATIGRTILFEGKEAIDKLMDYTPENMAKLEARADNLLAQKTEELKKAFQSGNQVAIEQASVGYMYAEKYKLQQKFNPYDSNERIKKIQSSITPLNTKNMENAENKEKREMKDGVSVFKMQNGQYGINEVKDGVRTPTKRLHEEDVKAYFEGLKGQTKEEVNRRREILADKYLRGNEQAQLVEQAPKKELPPVSPEIRNRLGNTSVFKMQDGANYGVRTLIDGEQYSAKRVRREDIAAFFDGYKGLPKEQQDERKAQLAAVYFKDELSAPKQDYGQGMKR